MTQFLAEAHEPGTPGEARALYDRWSATYEREVGEAGYATPRRVAAALASAVADREAPILDMGCGTGLSGLALREVGFATIDGVDVSSRMLVQAEDKAAYRALIHAAPSKPTAQIARGDYAAVVACGVIGPGGAPFALFDACMGLLNAGGVFVLSLNDRALAEPESEAAIERWVPGRSQLLLREHGPHLPGIGLRSTVVMLRR